MSKKVLDFHAEWCQPCQSLKPIIAELEQKYPDVQFVKIDVDQDNETTTKYCVSALPTLVFLKQDNEVERIVGTANRNKLDATLDRLNGNSLA